MAFKLSNLQWYWHRLRAMDPREVALRLQKKVYQLRDTRRLETYSGSLDPKAGFPSLPPKAEAPVELLAGLRSSVDAILVGRWLAFGHLPLQVDDPPKWQFDYLVGRDFHSSESAFSLDHRAKPFGGDIKIIWEPNRWNQVVRLAMGAWLLGDLRAQEKCLEWLSDWVRQNPPFTGLNWTSGLETGLRLVQYTWIDTLLAAAGVSAKALEELRRQILPPHIWYTWRYRSFGSSANNHLLGELAGVILALSRWPGLASISTPLNKLVPAWEKEVLAQFAEDGGNKEQALGYHLFSLEFCWQCERAIEGAGLTVASEVKKRIRAAAEFYARAKPEGDPWDFGDGDNAWVTPLFADETRAAREWWRWCNDSKSSPALHYWWGAIAKCQARPRGWRLYPASGLAIFESDDWFIRLDYSPLGYLSIAPHGHLDALHLSVYFRGEPIIIDPGTGAYYADKLVRNYLAGWSAHNSPHIKVTSESFPQRQGTFLWSEHHEVPRAVRVSDQTVRAELSLPYGKASRSVTAEPGRRSLVIRDLFESNRGALLTTTRWKFAPHLQLQVDGPGKFVLAGASAPLRFEISPAWKAARSYDPPANVRGKVATNPARLGNVPIESIASPAFRALASAPWLTLESEATGPLEVTLTAG